MVCAIYSHNIRHVDINVNNSAICATLRSDKFNPVQIARNAKTKNNPILSLKICIQIIKQQIAQCTAQHCFNIL